LLISCLVSPWRWIGRTRKLLKLPLLPTPIATKGPSEAGMGKEVEEAAIQSVMDMV
jgi:hypothetical protein